MKIIIELVFYLAFLIAFGVGYVVNILAICHTAGFSGMLVMRVIGVFCAPLGAVLGYF